jgi:hypothetical protein
MSANKPLIDNNFKKLRRAIQFRRRLVINRDDEELIEEWREQLRVLQNMSKKDLAFGIDYTLRNRKARISSGHTPECDEAKSEYIKSVSLPFDMPLRVLRGRVIIINSYEICLGFIHSPDLIFVNLKINGVDTDIPHKTFSWSTGQVFTALYSHNLTMGAHYCREAIFCNEDGIVDLEDDDVKGVFCFVEGVFNNITRCDKDVFERYYRHYCQIQAVRTIQKWYKSCKNRENLDELLVEPPPSYEELYGSS